MIVGSGAGGAAAAAALAEAGLDVIVLEAGGHYNRDTYPEGPPRGDRDPLPRRRPDDRRGQPADPGPGRADDRRHDGDQLRHLLPRARRRCSTTGATSTASPGRRDLDPYFVEAEEFLRVTPLDPERMGRNGQLAMEGAAALGASRRRRSPATPATASSAAPARSAAGSTPSAACTSATCPARWPRAPGSAPGSKRAGSWSRTAARSGSSATGGPRRNGRRRAYTVRARRATIVAGGALGTPELLLRSGLGGDQVGRNLHIHPACWVGARYEEEVRGWEGVMQSYYIDEWEGERVLLEATFTPLAFGGGWLQGAGRAHQEAMLDFGHIGSIGVQLADHSARPGRPARRRLAEDHATG